ncbi:MULTISPECIES: OmpA family protein [Actinomyces]|nr:MULTISPECIES: OmpA family protein [Actinomyces]
MSLFPTEGEARLHQNIFTRTNFNTGSLISGMNMLDLSGSAYYPESGGSDQGILTSVSAADPMVLNPLFAAVPEGAREVALFLPHFGVIPGVPVVGSTDVFDVGAALAASSPDLEDAGPFPLRALVGSDDGSSATEDEGDSTTVVLSSDVTFASDSAELSADADGVLASVTAALGRFPSGGGLAVTGHTDDVDSDAHNQELSERRAQAVGDRLGQLADLSGWQVSLAGKGESEPRVPNDSDENRAVNRRVEVVLTPSEPAEGEDEPVIVGSGEMPKPAGPVGTGAQGVDVTYKGKTLHVSMDQVQRVDGYLVGRVLLSSKEKDGVFFGVDAFHMPPLWQSYWGSTDSSACSLSLLSGNTRYLPMQVSIDGGLWAVTNARMQPVGGPDAPVLVPVVWPDTGQDTVTLDLPGNGKDKEAIALRLTDIPVVEA